MNPPSPPDGPLVSAPPGGIAARHARRRDAALGRKRRRLLTVACLAVLVLLSPAVYSYTRTMLRPSSLPLGVRSVEWLRSHHGNWLVDEAASRRTHLCAGRCRFPPTSAGGCSPPSTAASPTATGTTARPST